jgi:Protein of unknown function (DUF2971)
MKDIIQALYGNNPSQDLYHYTSIDSLQGIVKDKSLWATEIKYLNDSREFSYFTDLVSQKAHALIVEGGEFEVEVATQIRSWISDWFVDSALIFTTSFTENGNVLSQWRGYCEHGKGVSLGFHASEILSCAQHSSFKLGRCIYDWERHRALADHVVTRLIDAAAKNGPDPKLHASQRYYSTFQGAAAEIIQIAVLMKHPAFEEEKEWRCVSEPITNYVEAPIEYRSGRASLVPFLRFPLPVVNNALAVKTAIVGPSPSPDLAFNGISRFLAKYARTGETRQVIACQIPYRA